MNELILLFTIIALLVYLWFKEASDRKERKELIKAIMAKNLNDLTATEVVDKMGITPKPKTQEDLAEINTVDQTIFDKAIKQQLEGEKEK